MFTPPSAFRGTPGAEIFTHCAANGGEVMGVPRMTSATAASAARRTSVGGSEREHRERIRRIIRLTIYQ